MKDAEQAGPLGSEEHEPQPDRTTISWVTLVTALLAVFALSLILVPNFLKARTRGQLTACKSNVKNIATALEAYAADNAGNYPQSLQELVNSRLLRALPTCPGAGEVTYLDYQVPTEPDSFSFSCCGDHHKRAYTGFNIKGGYPQYNSNYGLIDHP